ncbi:isoaspartyl peptidase/L-asparaginase, partial [Halomonas sp. SIMBA_159]
EHSPHVMMAGDGAEAFAKEQGITLVDPSYFRTDKRWQQLQRALKEEAAKQAHADLETARHFGTVGALLTKFDQWARWRDERLVAENPGATASAAVPGRALPFAAPAGLLTPPPGVAPQGRRLKRGGTWL